MKSYIYDWGCGKERMKSLGFESNQEIESDKVFEIAKTIFDKGLNVMIWHSRENTILGVDVLKFQQR